MINCILIDDEPLSRETLEEYIQKVPSLKLLGSFEDPISVMGMMNDQNIDLIFSDIQMPEMNGISFLKSLKNPPFVIFVTAHSQFAVDGFELDVLDYIIKPFSFERFFKAINKAQKAIEVNKKGLLGKEYLTVKDRHKILIIQFDDIYYVEGMKDYVKIITPEKTVVSMQTMKEMEMILPSNKFLRIQKSYIVNITCVKSMDATKVDLKFQNISLPIGPQYKKKLYEKVGIKKH